MRDRLALEKHPMKKSEIFRSLLLVGSVLGCSTNIALADDVTINAFRAANGRPTLRLNSTLIALARAHAEDMARREKLDHAGFLERRGPGVRAENVSYGCADSSCTLRRWLKSPRHRANMLLRDVSRYGLASAVSKSGRRYWALELGK